LNVMIDEKFAYLSIFLLIVIMIKL
jgi:hypothetical protein